MPIKQLKVTIKNNDETRVFKTKGVKTENSIKYVEEDNTKIVYYIKEKSLVRETHDLKIDLLFSKEKGTIHYKKINNTYEIPIKTKQINVTDNSIYIEYLIDNNEFNYRIEVTNY